MTDQFLQCRFTKLTEKPCWFAVLQEERRVSGVVVYRHEKRGRLAFVSVLGAYGDDLPELLLSWSTLMRQQGIRLAHVDDALFAIGRGVAGNGRCHSVSIYTFSLLLNCQTPK